MTKFHQKLRGCHDGGFQISARLFGVKVFYVQAHQIMNVLFFGSSQDRRIAFIDKVFRFADFSRRRVLGHCRREAFDKLPKLLSKIRKFFLKDHVGLNQHTFT